MGDLLEILIKKRKLNSTEHLPKDARTLLQTPRAVQWQACGNGQYWHCGIDVYLRNFFHDLSQDLTISINVNMDGLPVFNSSKIEFWPILINVFEMKDIQPMVAGIYCGVGKPANITEFLSQFVEEMLSILRDGIRINGYKLAIRIRCFICDSPARAFIKCCANFNSQHGCLKCQAIGEYCHLTNCNIYPARVSLKRTDSSFRNRIDEDHHKGMSPLEKLPIDMVNDVPASDVLHLIHLGIMKKLLVFWKNGKFKNVEMRWSARDIDSISKLLLQCNMPREIHRKVRGLDCLAFWKGVEFRTFFHYISVVILRDFLPPEMYNHFLKLFCAITICTNDQYIGKYLHVADVLLADFVQEYEDIYGKGYITANVHNLLHIVDDVKQFGNLDTICAYPFENTLYKIKNLLKTGHRPLEQAANRISEWCRSININACSEKKSCEFPSVQTRKGHAYSITLQDGVSLRTAGNSDKWFLTKANEIVVLQEIRKCERGVHLIGNTPLTLFVGCTRCH